MLTKQCDFLRKLSFLSVEMPNWILSDLLGYDAIPHNITAIFTLYMCIYKK